MDLLQEGGRWRSNRQHKNLVRPEDGALQSPPVESSFPDLTARTQIPFPQWEILPATCPHPRGIPIIATSMDSPDQVWEGAQDP